MSDLQPSIDEVIRRMRLELGECYPPNEAYELSRRLGAHVFRLKPYEFALAKDRVCQPLQLRKINEAIVQLKRQVPLQYVLAEAEFFGLTLAVDPSVLIPRSETEELVAWIKQDMQGKKPGTILDIGTGSGAIALALKSIFAEAEIHALDVSEAALDLAARNSSTLALPLVFHQMDILNPGTDLKAGVGFDLIVSNPPYVRELERAFMESRVKDREPALALFVPDENPLVFYFAIARFASRHLNPGAALFLEINEAFGKEVIELLEKQGFIEIVLRGDLHGKDRMVKALMP